jgi:hypothetical protein
LTNCRYVVWFYSYPHKMTSRRELMLSRVWFTVRTSFF